MGFVERMRKPGVIRNLVHALTASVIFAFVIALTGCVHPCEFYSCNRTIKAIALSGTDGGINIDIRKFNSDDTATLHSIYVKAMPANADPNCCWEVVAKLTSTKNRVKFPIKYGQDIEGMKEVIPAKPLKNGRYQITGWMNFVENGEFVSARIAGEFWYDGKFIIE